MSYHTIRHWWRFAWAEYDEIMRYKTMWSSWGTYRHLIGNLWLFTPEEAHGGTSQ